MFDQKLYFFSKKKTVHPLPPQKKTNPEEKVSIFRRRCVLQRKCFLSVAGITSEMVDRNGPLFTLMLPNLTGFDSPESNVFPELHLFSFYPNLLS